ncbi:MAG: GTP-binding protein, partial [Oscillospiraceae bacterium]|nr:GTP-binding protein [Oscillospiraceae bacterium]
EHSQFAPDRIVIEPSGDGKMSDEIRAVEEDAEEDPDIQLNSFITVADASKCKVYMKNFGEFFNNQVEHAGCIILSRTGKVSEEKTNAAVELLRGHNATATIITTPWDQLTGEQILAAMERTSAEFIHELEEEMEHEHHHHHDEDEHEPHHDHDHHHDDEEEHEHHHHHHDEDEHQDHEHHHHHDGEECDDPNCSCHHHHDHDGHHHADEIFSSWGVETPKSFSHVDIDRILTALDDGAYGQIVRCKGIVPGGEGLWYHFDYVPEEHEIRTGSADVTGRICVIGAELKEDKLAELFGV